MHTERPIRHSASSSGVRAGALGAAGVLAPPGPPPPSAGSGEGREVGGAAPMALASFSRHCCKDLYGGSSMWKKQSWALFSAHGIVNHSTVPKVTDTSVAAWHTTFDVLLPPPLPQVPPHYSSAPKRAKTGEVGWWWGRLSARWGGQTKHIASDHLCMQRVMHAVAHRKRIAGYMQRLREDTQPTSHSRLPLTEGGTGRGAPQTAGRGWSASAGA